MAATKAPNSFGFLEVERCVVDTKDSPHLLDFILSLG